MADFIHIHQLAIKTIIGVNAWERHHPQTLLLDLILQVDLASASQSDVLSETVDYDALSQWIHDSLSTTQFQLIEKMAGFTADNLLARFPLIQEVTISVTKPAAIPIAQAVKVTLSRQRQLLPETA